VIARNLPALHRDMLALREALDGLAPFWSEIAPELDRPTACVADTLRLVPRMRGVRPPACR